MAKTSFTAAFCGMISALGVALLAMCGIIPLLTYAAPLYVSLLLIPVIREAGEKAGWCVWIVTTLLVFLLGVDKEAAVFYLFLGNYPLVKLHLDRIKNRPLRTAAKLGYFLFVVAAQVALLLWVLRLDSVVEEYAATARWLEIIMNLGMVLILLIYDKLVERMTTLYCVNLRKKWGIAGLMDGK